MDLDQLRFIKNEIELIKSQIDKLESQVVTDVVSGSSTHYPYNQRKFVITGIEQCDKRLVNRFKARLSEHLDRLLNAQNEMLEFVQSVEDSELRQILLLRYLEGLSWQEISRKLGTAGDGSTERKKINRFLQDAS